MNIIDIDYNNPLHNECIWKLSKKNNFHKDDLSIVLYGDVEFSISKYEKMYMMFNKNQMTKDVKTKMYRNNSNYK